MTYLYPLLNSRQFCTPHTPQKICIIGAGLLGLTLANSLRSKGIEVTLVDRQARSGVECSFGNACLLMRSYSRPKTISISKMIKFSLRKDCPAYIKPSLDPFFIKFGLSYLKNYPKTSSKIFELSQYMDKFCEFSTNEFYEILATTKINVDAKESGFLQYYRTMETFEDGIKEAKESLGNEGDEGVNWVSLSKSEVLNIEPQLHHISHEIIGGIYHKKDTIVDPFQFSTALQDYCFSNGVKFVGDFEVKDFIVEKDSVRGIISKQGQIFDDADAFVIATGAFAPMLCKSLGVGYIYIYPMKGHSITLNLGHLQQSNLPRVSIFDGDYGVVMTPIINARLRVTGYGDFVGYKYGPSGISQFRLEQLIERVSQVYPNALPYSEAEKSAILNQKIMDNIVVSDRDPINRWSGLRPQTPDSIPYIGRLGAYKNVFLNSGHGSLGWSTSCGSGRVLSELILGEKPSFDVSKFNPNRFT